MDSFHSNVPPHLTGYHTLITPGQGGPDRISVECRPADRTGPTTLNVKTRLREAIERVQVKRPGQMGAGLVLILSVPPDPDHCQLVLVLDERATAVHYQIEGDQLNNDNQPDAARHRPGAIDL